MNLAMDLTRVMFSRPYKCLPKQSIFRMCAKTVGLGEDMLMARWDDSLENFPGHPFHNCHRFPKLQECRSPQL